GPRLRAGFVLVPDTDASKGTMTAYKNGNIAGVKLRMFRNARNKHSPVTMAKVVTASPIVAARILYPSPGTVAPKEMLRPIEPQASSGRQPTLAPASCAVTKTSPSRQLSLPASQN